MTSGFALLLMAAQAGGVPPASPASVGEVRCEGGDARSCAYILAAERALTGMLVTADPAPIARYSDPAGRWTLADGTVRSPAAMAALVRADRPRATARLDRAHVAFFGDTAIVRWAESWTSHDPARPRGALFGTDSWVRRDGRWRIVASHEGRRAD